MTTIANVGRRTIIITLVCNVMSKMKGGGERRRKEWMRSDGMRGRNGSRKDGMMRDGGRDNTCGGSRGRRRGRSRT